jgi:16S rRNA (cytidine1402-2'-O)-methyltransferase
MSESPPPCRGRLCIVSTPIGNPDDITIRAVATLRSADVVVCEDRNEAGKLLHRLGIERDLIELNEHTDERATSACLELLRAGKTLALISDAGTPLIADPGNALVASAIGAGCAVDVVPGVSSILVALVRSGLPTEQFLYAGFLSRKKIERQRQAQRLALEPRTIVLLDTPYRLDAVLSALAEVMPDRRAYIGCNLTMATEAHHYGRLSELREKFAEQRFRGEYVIVIEGNPDTRRWYAELCRYADERASTTSASQLLPDQGTSSRSTPDASPLQSRGLHHEYHQRRRRHLDERRHRNKSSTSAQSNRYDYQQPIVNYTMSNPYQQHPSKQPKQGGNRSPRRSRKRWRR